MTAESVLKPSVWASMVVDNLRVVVAGRSIWEMSVMEGKGVKKSINVLSVSCFSCAAIALLCVGCPPRGPVEIITLVAPPGMSYECSVDDNPVGLADENGLDVSVSPGEHTASWMLGEYLVVVDLPLSVTANLLNYLLNMLPRETLYLYRAQDGRAGTASDAPRGGQPYGTISYGQGFDRSYQWQNACAQGVSTVNCTAGNPETFVAEVRAQILSECVEVGN